MIEQGLVPLLGAPGAGDGYIGGEEEDAEGLADGGGGDGRP